MPWGDLNGLCDPVHCTWILFPWEVAAICVGGLGVGIVCGFLIWGVRS